MDCIAKKGKKYKIYESEFFKTNDRVISLEDSEVPYCILASDFNGSLDEKDYSFTKCQPVSRFDLKEI